MSEDIKEKLDAYKQGYKDGYNDAVEFYIVNPRKNMHPDHYKCSICGISGVHSSVCYLPNCPSRAYLGTIGAAGSDTFSNYPLGANGGTKPNEPLVNHQLDYSEYDNKTYRR